MGQYWMPVNLDKREFINPHKLGSGLKLWEQIANDPGVGAALVILTAAMPEARGGGDFDLDRNWHGPERKDMTKDGPMPQQYPAIAARTIGRWAGDRIALVGDYAEDGDLKDSPVPASSIYHLCHSPEDGEFESDDPNAKPFTDITLDVCAVIEHELCGKFKGDGWRTFVGEDAGKYRLTLGTTAIEFETGEPDRGLVRALREVPCAALEKIGEYVGRG